MIMYLGVDKVERRNFNKGIFLLLIPIIYLEYIYESSEISLTSEGGINFF